MLHCANMSLDNWCKLRGHLLIHPPLELDHLCIEGSNFTEAKARHWCKRQVSVTTSPAGSADDYNILG